MRVVRDGLEQDVGYKYAVKRRQKHIVSEKLSNALLMAASVIVCVCAVLCLWATTCQDVCMFRLFCPSVLFYVMLRL